MVKIRVMGAFEPFLNNLTIFNQENFHGSDRRVVARNIVRVILISTILLSMITSTILLVMQCVAIGADLITLSLLISVTLELARLMMVYISLQRKNRIITNLVGHLQLVIEKREFLILSYKLTKVDFFLSIILTGIEKSKDANITYTHLERTLGKITKTLSRVFIGSTALIFLTVITTLFIDHIPNTLPVEL